MIANGDIDTPEKAQHVLGAHRRGRGHDRPRGAGPAVDLPRDRALPRDRRDLPPPEVRRNARVLLEHLDDLYAFYGEDTGVRIARKHISLVYRRGSRARRHFATQ